VRDQKDGDAGSAREKPAALPVFMRLLSAFELALGSFIVVAHNLFQVLPNEVPILLILGVVSIRLREGSWRALGFGRPKSWLRTALTALLVAGLIVLGQFATEPLATALGFKESGTSSALGVKPGDLGAAVKALAISWTFAAFGEEFVYRRYLLARAYEIGDGTPISQVIGLIYVSSLFGIGHYYAGTAGMIETAFDGLLIGSAYLLSGRNLWVAVLAHGLFDTLAFGLTYMGIG